MPRSREREIKKRIRGTVKEEKKERRKTECKFFSHTFLVSSFWWFCWTNLIVGVQTTARGAVCVFCRSHLKISERKFGG